MVTACLPNCCHLGGGCALTRILAESWLLLCQVVHCVLGLVPAAVMATLLQVYSRVFVVWALMEGVAGVRDNVGVLIVSYAWAVTEVVRYAYYFFSLLQSVPYALVWCR